MHANFLDPFHLVPARFTSLMRASSWCWSRLHLHLRTHPIAAWPVYILLLALVFSAELLSEMASLSTCAAPCSPAFVLAALPVLFTVEGTRLLTLPSTLP